MGCRLHSFQWSFFPAQTGLKYERRKLCLMSTRAIRTVDCHQYSCSTSIWSHRSDDTEWQHVCHLVGTAILQKKLVCYWLSVFRLSRSVDNILSIWCNYGLAYVSNNTTADIVHHTESIHQGPVAVRRIQISQGERSPHSRIDGLSVYLVFFFIILGIITCSSSHMGVYSYKVLESSWIVHT